MSPLWKKQPGGNGSSVSVSSLGRPGRHPSLCAGGLSSCCIDWSGGNTRGMGLGYKRYPGPALGAPLEESCWWDFDGSPGVELLQGALWIGE
ncbi:hypothetical protein NHX12_012777 [Muraenolepis orangiensis]|uniref:Uncharacterized protein n=1 Tax=Muraenolepis orangiensis TaxID=630683 RepID=A0A9Q0DDD8_9TELE|nr:hypothetical protein NHX12_012777 [Muraenolepis orangiensis]